MERKTVGIVLASVVGTLAVVAAVVLWIVYSGEYNVAATKAHYGPVAWALETTMERSVRDHASELPPPPPVDSAQLMTGLHHFDAMCVTCHGAPGVERSEIGEGLLPHPPELSEVARDWTPRELFWLAKHGIKMSGMPAFGPTHDDETLWGIVAVVRRLPELTPEQYRALRERAGDGDHEHGAREQAPAGGEGETAHEHDHEH